MTCHSTSTEISHKRYNGVSDTNHHTQSNPPVPHSLISPVDKMWVKVLFLSSVKENWKLGGLRIAKEDLQWLPLGTDKWRYKFFVYLRMQNRHFYHRV